MKRKIWILAAVFILIFAGCSANRGEVQEEIETYSKAVEHNAENDANYVLETIIEQELTDNQYPPSNKEELLEEELEIKEDDMYPPTPLALTNPQVRWLVEPKWDFNTVDSFIGGMSWAIAFGYVDNIRTTVYGYINNLGEIVIPFENPIGEMGTSAASPPGRFSEGLVVMQPRNDMNWGITNTGVRGVFNTEGDLILSLEEYWWVSDFSGGTIRVWGDTEGDIDIEGNFVFKIPPEFDSVGRFHNGIAIAYKDGLAGFIDIDSNIVIPFQFDAVATFSERLAAVAIDNKMGFINEYGDLIIPLDFDVYFDGYWGDPILPRFRDGLVRVMQGENWDEQKWGFINTQGEIIVPLIYDWVTEFWQERAIVHCREIWGTGLIDIEGNIIVPIEEGMFMSWWISEGLVSISNNRGEYGFIDLDGNVVIPLIYWSVQPFSQGFAAVSHGSGWDNQKWGFIDVGGNVIVPIEFDEVRSFSEGLAWVRQGRWWGIIEIVEE